MKTTRLQPAIRIVEADRPMYSYPKPDSWLLRRAMFFLGVAAIVVGFLIGKVLL